MLGRSIQRVVLSVAGGACGVALVALVEGRAVALAEPAVLGYAGLVVAEVGVLAPLGVLVALGIAALMLFLEPSRALAPGEHLASLRTQPVLMRSRTAAIAPLAIVGAFVWCAASANIARVVLARGTPASAGMELSAASLAVLVAVGAVALALLPGLRRLLAAGASVTPHFIDPVATGGAAFVLVGFAFMCGVWLGDVGGGRGGAPAIVSWLTIFGVLRRNELDLRPVVHLASIMMGAYLTPIAFSSFTRRRAIVVAAFVALIPLALTVREASALTEHPHVARAIERNAPLGRMALLFLRRATDRDKDGASALFGGGDCDDKDARRSPTGVEIPSNGVDEDCSGADLVLIDPVETEANTATHGPAIDLDLNLIFITVDTLRIDVGFMGYPKPVTPNLDRLAAKGTVFDRAYAMASYTGKSVGPLLIGKYPSETDRDGGHFNIYSIANVFLAERLKAAGIRTMGAASHWYFNRGFGLAQGIDEWDMTAKPKDGQGDLDTSVTSEALSDAALRMLDEPENATDRFFMWLHYFDPHEQYMPHEGAPDFAPDSPSFIEQQKAAYDGEVWFTDKHIGRVIDYVESQPWGARTAIVLTSDHGESFAEHNMSFHGGELWEPLVRVPLLVYVPGVSPHHVPVKRSHIDVVPTLLEIMGIARPPAKEVSGRSMMDDIVASPGATFEERDVYIDMPPGPYTGMRHALISGPSPGMKLTHVWGDQFTLYDLADDPEEKVDLASDRARLAEMVQRFQQTRARLREINVPPVTPGTP